MTGVTFDRKVELRRTGTAPGSIGVEILLVPIGADPESDGDITVSITLIPLVRGRSADPVSVEVAVPKNGASRTETVIVLPEGADPQEPIKVKAVANHGTRHSGMHEQEI